jgi:LmbE family N-acetylglucosaminyl deacetylase
MRTPFDDIVKAFQHALDLPEPAVAASPIALQSPAADAPCCLICSPHPDDESLVGGLALRLRHDHGWRIINMAITLGSQVSRRQTRWQEAEAACNYLGFELASPVQVVGKAFENITLQAFDAQTPQWLACVATLAERLQQLKPRLILMPHALDGHTTHCATHQLVIQALRLTNRQVACHLLLSEYWNTQTSPHLMLELSPPQVGQLMTATAMHVGEVARNPYHRSLPAWLMDGARRGAERVGLPGQAATSMRMAALYGWQLWNGELKEGPKACVKSNEPLDELFTHDQLFQSA